MRKSKYCMVKEVCEILNVSPRTVYYYCQRGYLDYTKPVGLIYITRASLNKFIKYGKPKPRPKKTTTQKRRMTMSKTNAPQTNAKN
jgi:helix-turn-helix protein